MTLAVRLGLTVLALVVVLWLVGPWTVWQALARLDPLWLGLSIAALWAQIVLSAFRWRLTAGALGMSVPRIFAVREYGLSVASNTFLPGGVLGDLARIARARHHGWGNATASVVIERLAGQVALAALVIVGLLYWQVWWLAGLAALSVMVFIWGGMRAFPAQARLVRHAWIAPEVWRAQLALSVAILALNVAGYWAAGLSAGIELGASAALVLIPITLLAMLIPLTVNGWGLREGLAAALWPVWGIASAQAVAASVAFGVACMAAALLGLVAWVATSTGRQQV